MKNNKKLIWIIGLLVLINIVSVGAIWMNGKSKGNRGEKYSMERKTEMLKEKLSLDDQQLETFMKLRKTHFSNLKDFGKKEKELKIGLIETTLSSNIDSSKISDLKNQLAKLIVEKEQFNLDHMKEVVHDFSPEQKQKFIEMTKAHLERGHGKHHKGKKR